jgi:hypothetical protein
MIHSDPCSNAASSSSSSAKQLFFYQQLQTTSKRIIHPSIHPIVTFVDRFRSNYCSIKNDNYLPLGVD